VSELYTSWTYKCNTELPHPEKLQYEYEQKNAVCNAAKQTMSYVEFKFSQLWNAVCAVESEETLCLLHVSGWFLAWPILRP
jgi:hypothetical protein